MGTNTMSTRSRTTTAAVAATLTIVLAIDPFGMGLLVSSVVADPPDDGSLSRSARVDAVVAALGLDPAVTANNLTGSWPALPPGGTLPSAPATAPSEDEQLVVLSGEGGESGPVAYRTSVQHAEDPSPVDLGGMAVTVAAADAEATPEAVLLHVADQADALAAGVTGVLIDVTDASEAPAQNAEVDLTISYETFAGLVGGDWASRLRIIWIPDCGPQTPDCRPVPLDTVNDVAAQTVTATVPVEAGVAPSVHVASFALEGSVSSTTTGAEGGGSGGSLAVAAGASGSEGDWGATSLSPATTWGGGGSTGAFTWSLPFTSPAVAGPTPELGLSYSSGGSDGRTPNTNNQSGLVGEGFDITSSYVERSYVPCSQDEEGAPNNIDRDSGDLCWGTENATLMFNGSAMEVVHDVATNTWHSKLEDGSLVEKLTGAWNGGQADEYWKVTTADGVQYVFGRGQRSATDTTPLNSAWTVPVYGNHAGEPCHQAEFSDSRCTQVWRWNLEYVVDPSGNSMTYFYSNETNNYVYDIEDNSDRAIVSYTSGGRLDRIEYGTRAGSESAAAAPAQVRFSTSPRCITDLAVPDSWCSSGQTPTDSNHWLDTPVDLVCTATPCTNYTPVFFDRYRLNDVSTFAYDGAAYQPVDSWGIQQRFVASGTSGLEHAATPMLVATAVTHTGKGGTAATTDDLTLLPNEFGYAYLDNRVDSTADGVDPLRRPRVSEIRTETGASVTVNYRTECSSSDKPDTTEVAQQANTKLCYPVEWSQSDYSDAVVEYFHKYVVETIIEAGSPPDGTTLVTGSVATQTSYTYSGGAAWAKPTGAMVKTDEVTYSDFRGFSEVTTTVGLGSESSSTKSVYFRGMGGSLSGGPDGYTVTAGDILERRGQLFNSITLDGALVLSESITVPGEPVVTATDANGNTASRLPSSESFTFGYDAAGALEFRTGSKTTYDSNSQSISEENLGDRADATDNVCLTVTYAHTADTNLASKHLISQVSRTDTVAGSCSATPTLPNDLISSATSTFDSAGRLRQSYSIDPNDGVGYVLTSEVLEYDSRGRPLRAADALGQVSTTSYQDSAGGLLLSTASTTPDPDGAGPLTGFSSTMAFNPLTGSALTTTDMNGRVTAGTYDALGRLLTVRYPEHQSSALPSIAYEYAINESGLNAVITKTLGADGATQHVSAALYDGMLHLFQTQVEGSDAGADHDADAEARGRLVSQIYYDSAGRVAKQTGQWAATGAPAALPVYFDTVPPSETTFDYDGAGRTVAEVFSVGTSSNVVNEKWRTVTSYDGGTILLIPPIGGTPQEVVTDALGRTVALRMYSRDPDADAAADLPSEVLNLSHQSTTYTFDVAGRMTEMHDPEGNVWSYEYDWAGRRIGATDPDSGVSSTTYDLAGQVLTHTDGNGETLAYTYDPLGRKTTMRDDSVTGAVRAQWVYDQSTDPSNHIVLGQLSSATRFVDGAAYTTSVPRYDDAYRPLVSTVALPNIPAFAALDSRAFSTGYSYTADGQVASTSLPAVSAGGVKRLGGEVVTTRFDTASQPSWMGGGFGWGTYVAESRFAADGRPLITDLGNTYGSIVSYRYEDGTNRLSTVALDREGVSGAEVSLNYAYDGAGNVVSIKDQPTSVALSAASHQDNQCFSFDGLSRLQLAFTASGGDCAVVADGVVAAEVGGISPYWSDYSYDALGNRTQLVQHSVGSSAATATTDYTQGAGTSGPHQTTSVAKTVGSSTITSTFTYDAAGNRETVTAGGVTANYDWDAEGELAGVGSADYIYDASGSRLVRSDASGTTVYLPGGQEITIAASTVSATRYYSFAGETVAVRTGNGLAAVSSLVSDHHGSVVAAVPNTASPVATAVQRMYSDPFGAQRSASSTIAGDHRFLGAVRDASSGLTLLEARYYDEVLGQFISVDPLLDTSVQAHFNAYCYSFNNPLSLSDPTGMRPAPEEPAWKPLASVPKDTVGQWLEDRLQNAVDNSGFTGATQNPSPEFEAALAAAGFVRNEDGDYVTPSVSWQLLFGYNDIYDDAFHLGTDMVPVKFEFEFDDHTCVLWAWKGDYLNLGAGGEIGFYTQYGPFQGGAQWLANPWDPDIPEMTMTLSRDDEVLVSHAPDQAQTWVAGWSPDEHDPLAGELVNESTVTFPNPDMYDAFYDTYKSNTLWDFDRTNHTATLRFRRRKRVR